MKTIIFSLLILSLNCCFLNNAMSQSKSASPSVPNQSKGVLRHVVLLKFKDSATPAQIKDVEKAFSALPSKINTITGFEWGTNVSPENLAQDYTHCYLLSFKNAADRDAYLPHPAHKAFGQLLSPYLDKVLVVDYFSQQ